MKTGALKAAKRLLKPDKAIRIDPFDVVSRTRTERHDVTLHHADIGIAEHVHDPRLYLLNAAWQPQQLQFLVMGAAEPSSTPQAIRLFQAPGAPDTTMHVGGVFPSYLTSMLVMFVHATSKPELPIHIELEVKNRLERIERVIQSAATKLGEEKAQVNWDLLAAAIAKAAEALGWQAQWTVDRAKSEVLGRVAGLSYGQLARHKLDFYEHVAAGVDKETFKAVEFELEPAE